MSPVLLCLSLAACLVHIAIKARRWHLYGYLYGMGVLLSIKKSVRPSDADDKDALQILCDTLHANAKRDLRARTSSEGTLLKPIQDGSLLISPLLIWLGGGRWLALVIPCFAWACGRIYVRVKGSGLISRGLQRAARQLAREACEHGPRSQAG